MIKVNTKEVVDIYVGTKNVIRKCLGAKTIWEKITEIFSCFSNGFWNDNYPWVDDEIWTD